MHLFSTFLLLSLSVASISGLIDNDGVPQQRLGSYDEFSKTNPLEGQDFEKYVSEVLDEFNTPGISIAVIHKDKTWSKGFGYSDLSSQKRMTPRTLFFAGSTTKSFTAAVASKLVYSNDSQYQNIDWNTRLADLTRDDFVLQNEHATNHITFVDALSHRTGMPRHDVSWTNGGLSIREQVRQMRHLPLHNELRVQWEYCNLMFTAVSHALKTVIGVPMFKILKDWIWDPLGMRETFYRLQDALEYADNSNGAVSMSRSYLWDNETKAYAEVPFEDIPPENGAGGVISNVVDYTHWVRQFLDPSKGGNPLGPDAVADISGAHMLVPPSWHPYNTHTYGLGLETATYRGHLFTGHQGAIAGYMAAMYWFPELHWGFVALQNSYSFATYAVQFKLMDDFLDSISAQGEAYDIRAKARELENLAAAKLRRGRKIVYPDAPDLAVVGPALPLTEYEGKYHHPAYQNISLTISSVPRAGADTIPGAPLPLFGIGSQKSYLNMTWTFHHVSGEHWWVHFKTGPGFFMTDELLKAKFDVGVNGKVSGLGLQAEKALDELAWFEKLC